MRPPFTTIAYKLAIIVICNHSILLSLQSFNSPVRVWHIHFSATLYVVNALFWSCAVLEGALLWMCRYDALRFWRELISHLLLLFFCISLRYLEQVLFRRVLFWRALFCRVLFCHGTEIVADFIMCFPHQWCNSKIGLPIPLQLGIITYI